MSTNETEQGTGVPCSFEDLLLRTGGLRFYNGKKSTYQGVRGTDFGRWIVCLYHQSTLLTECGFGAPDLATGFYI